MTAGRPATSLADKIKNGTFRADRINFNEPQPSDFDPANPFSEETDLEAWKMWEFLVPELTERYGVGKGERGLVQAYCTFYQRALRADDELDTSTLTVTDENGTVKVNPVVKISESSWDRVVSLGSKLGLDPISRRRVRAPRSGPLGVMGGPQILSLADRARDRSLGPDDAIEKPKTGDPLLDSLSD